MLSYINHNLNIEFGNNLTFALILRKSNRDHVTQAWCSNDSPCPGTMIQEKVLEKENHMEFQ